MASIFLSYAREDVRKAQRVAAALASDGHSVWWDRELHPGQRFSAEIKQALASAELVVVLWSRSSVESPWVQDEAAVGRDSSRLMPVLIEPVEPPLGFRQYHALDLVAWNGRRKGAKTEGLLEAVKARLSGAPAPAAVPRPSLASLPRRRAWAVAALVILLLVAAGVFFLRAQRTQAQPASLAVLPFNNLSSGDPYFAEGVAEEILSQLAREPQFKVVGRTSSAMFKDAADVRDIGRRLHVAYVLEGTVRSAGDQVRVDVSLVDAKQGMRLWSQNFHGKLDDIFAIQDNIGRQVATHLKRQLVRQVALKGTTTRGEVYGLYVTARSLMRLREPANIAAAVDLLKRAVKLDPNYAPAWAELASATRLSHFYGHEDEPVSNWVRPEDLRYAERAVALAPDLGRTHAILGMLATANNVNAEEATKRRGRAELERAVKLDPQDAEAWYWLHGVRQNDLDFEGALEAVRHTAEIDPFFVFSNYYPHLAWEMGERDAAVRFVKNRIENHPDAYNRERARADLAHIQNDWSGFYLSLKKARDVGRPDMRPYAQEGMGFILQRLGLIEEARRYLPPEFLAARLGNPPPIETLFRKDPLDFWLNSAVPFYSRLLINRGRSADLVSLYDRAFQSPEAMLARIGKPEFVTFAPVAAPALQDVGRKQEAAKLLTMADKLCNDAIRRGRTPIGFQVNCSRTWAMLGRSDQTLRMLQRAMTAGWRPDGGWSVLLTDEPAYRSMRNDPRLKRLGSNVVAENERERRELLAVGV